MATENQDAPAQTPAAGPPSNPAQGDNPRQKEIERLTATTEAGHFENGRKAGMEEGRRAEMKRLDAILAACPDKAMALDAFRGGQGPEAVKLAYDERVKAENAAREREAEKDLEIRRLKAQLATGGHSGVEMDFSSTDSDDEPRMDPKLQAEREWDHKPSVRKGFSKKENYVNFRKAQLEGRVHIVQGQSA